MSRRSFSIILLAAFLISSCGGGAAPAAEKPAATEAPAAPMPQAPAVSVEQVMPVDVDLYRALSTSKPAPADRVALAISIQNLDPAQIPAAPAQPVRTYQAGDTRTFWAQDSATFQFKQIAAKLMLISEHAYFWQDVNSKALNAAGQESTEKDWAAAGESFDALYNRVREIFGHEETPGLDGDPRLFVVHSDSIGMEGGHFSQIDQLPAVVEPHSNEGQYFFISNTWSSGIPSDYYKEILAHEFQHMIHENVDPDEEGWLNEGLSMLAQQFAGMRGDNWVNEYLANPNQSLWYWGKTSADYGQSYLYLEYLYEQLGEDFIKALAADPANGMTSIDQTLKRFNSSRGADALYTDALSAAFFNDLALGSQFTYKIPALAKIFPINEFTSLPVTQQGAVQQYGGVDILTFAGKGRAMLNFSGDQRVKLIPADAHSGTGFWWSNRNDASFATLTRRVDLTNVSTTTLKYWAWYDIEEDWDYAYLLVSTDNGVHWTPLPTTSSHATNPNNQNLGHGFTGLSGGGNEAAWIQETANLNAYAGKRILLRFAMQNNLTVNHYGFAVDDLSIPEIGWNDDAEAGNKDWVAGGFIRAHNRIPQVWSVRTVEQRDDGAFTVHDLAIANGTGKIEFNLDDLKRLVVFVIGETRYTTIPANYKVEVNAGQ
jgi:hypothetical protein